MASIIQSENLTAIRVVAIAQYPPVEGIPTADGPINFALARYAGGAGAEVVWVFAREPEHRPTWGEDLEQLGVQAISAENSLSTCVSGIYRSLALAWKVIHPRRLLLLAKEAGVIEAGAREATHLHQPSVIFLASPYAGLLRPRRLDLPTVYNSMDSLTFAIENGSYGRRRGPAAQVRTLLMHRFDRFVCENSDLTTFVTIRDAQLAPYATDTATIPNGADIDRFPTARQDEKAPVPTFVFQGSPRYPPNRKAMEVIATEVAPLVWKEIPNATFRFVGGGNRSFSGDDARLQYLGYVDDLGAELRRAWVALAPIHDGAGIKNKVLDAAASGVPVIGFPEAFSGHEYSKGFLEVSTSPDMASAAVELARDSVMRQQFGNDAREFAESCSWPKQVQRYVDAWRRVRDCQTLPVKRRPE